MGLDLSDVPRDLERDQERFFSAWIVLDEFGDVAHLVDKDATCEKSKMFAVVDCVAVLILGVVYILDFRKMFQFPQGCLARGDGVYRFFLLLDFAGVDNVNGIGALTNSSLVTTLMPMSLALVTDCDSDEESLTITIVVKPETAVVTVPPSLMIFCFNASSRKPEKTARILFISGLLFICILDDLANLSGEFDGTNGVLLEEV